MDKSKVIPKRPNTAPDGEYRLIECPLPEGKYIITHTHRALCEPLKTLVDSWLNWKSYIEPKADNSLRVFRRIFKMVGADNKAYILVRARKTGMYINVADDKGDKLWETSEYHGDAIIINSDFLGIIGGKGFNGPAAIKSYKEFKVPAYSYIKPINVDQPRSYKPLIRDGLRNGSTYQIKSDVPPDEFTTDYLNENLLIYRYVGIVILHFKDKEFTMKQTHDGRHEISLRTSELDIRGELTDKKLTDLSGIISNHVNAWICKRCHETGDTFTDTININITK